MYGPITFSFCYEFYFGIFNLLVSAHHDSIYSFHECNFISFDFKSRKKTRFIPKSGVVFFRGYVNNLHAPSNVNFPNFGHFSIKLRLHFTYLANCCQAENTPVVIGTFAWAAAVIWICDLWRCFWLGLRGRGPVRHEGRLLLPRRSQDRLDR